MTRSLFICCLFFIALGTPLASGEAKDSTAVDIADRRELFVDRYLVQVLEGEARQILHHPVPREVVLVSDRPVKGLGCNEILGGNINLRFTLPLTTVPAALLICTS